VDKRPRSKAEQQQTQVLTISNPSVDALAPGLMPINAMVILGYGSLLNFEKSGGRFSI